MCKSNERTMVNVRVKPGPETYEVRQFYERCRGEFVKFIVGDAQGLLHPITFEELIARQRKAAQRRDHMAYADGDDVGGTLRSFMKRECYGYPNAPRPITTYPEYDKVRFGLYMHGLSDWLKTLEVCPFGATPRVWTERFARMVERVQEIVMLDFSYYDGSIHEFLRSVEKLLGIALFAPEYTDEFLRAYRAYHNRVVRTGYGVQSRRRSERGSGSAGTSVLNTLVNMFCTFVAMRLDHTMPRKPKDLGMFGGDDGASLAANKALVRAARGLKLELKSETRRRGDPLEFLGRQFTSNVWSGRTISICQIKRQIAKFHMTPDAEAEPLVKLHEKMVSFAMTDYNTPVIGDLVRCYEAIGGFADGLPQQGSGVRWWDQHDRENQYPNEMDEDFIDFVPEDFDYTRFIDWINTVKTPSDIINCPCFGTPDIRRRFDAVINGEELAADE
jgi:hypothetical protein